MRSKRAHEGYLLIDNRHAPGVSAEEAARAGKEVAGAGARGVFESATVTCAHCQRVVVLNPQRTRERGYCRRCDHYVCDNPACNIGCLPMNQALDLGLEAAHRNPSQVEDAVQQLRRDVLGR